MSRKRLEQEKRVCAYNGCYKPLTMHNTEIYCFSHLTVIANEEAALKAKKKGKKSNISSFQKLVDFEWSVFNYRYEPKNSNNIDSKNIFIKQSKTPKLVYKPFEISDLYLEFLQATDINGLTDFVNKRGLLFRNDLAEPPAEDSYVSEYEDLYTEKINESKSLYSEVHQKIYLLTTLYKDIQDKNVKRLRYGLSELVHMWMEDLEEEFRVTYPAYKPNLAITTTTSDAQLIELASYILSAKLTLSLASFYITPSIRVSRDSLLEPIYSVENLAGVLFLQLYLDITERANLLDCKNDKCGRLFRPSRRDNEFCSYKCKNAYCQREWQKKQKEVKNR